MAVEIRNESAVPLVWDHDDLRSGDWTDPWQPPRSIAPGARGEFRAEGSVVAGIPSTGTEGDVHYSLGGDDSQQLYVHWDSPLVESQYGNTFHVWAPRGFEAAFGGGQGHEARLEIRVRETAPRWVRGFIPSVCGFAFSNGSFSHDLPIVTVGYLWNRLLDALGANAAEQLTSVGSMTTGFRSPTPTRECVGAGVRGHGLLGGAPAAASGVRAARQRR